jgi:hypothetical protein
MQLHTLTVTFSLDSHTVLIKLALRYSSYKGLHMWKSHILSKFGLILVASAIWGCGNASEAPPKANGGAVTPSLEVAAKQGLETELARHYRRAGDRYVAKNSKLAGNFIEARGIEYEVKELPLNEADKLNGFDWRGRGTVKCAARRFYAPAGVIWDTKANGGKGATYQLDGASGGTKVLS